MRAPVVVGRHFRHPSETGWRSGQRRLPSGLAGDCCVPVLAIQEETWPRRRTTDRRPSARADSQERDNARVERDAALALRKTEYDEHIEHQSATIDVLKVMSASPGDPQPVFDLIVRRAQELCKSKAAGIFEYDGELVHIRSHYGDRDIAGLATVFRSIPHDADPWIDPLPGNS